MTTSETTWPCPFRIKTDDVVRAEQSESVELRLESQGPQHNHHISDAKHTVYTYRKEAHDKDIPFDRLCDDA